MSERPGSRHGSDRPERPAPPRWPSADHTTGGAGDLAVPGVDGSFAPGGVPSESSADSSSGSASPAGGARVVWPEAGQADDVDALDASRVPAVEQTGPMRARATAGSSPWPAAGSVLRTPARSRKRRRPAETAPAYAPHAPAPHAPAPPGVARPTAGAGPWPVAGGTGAAQPGAALPDSWPGRSDMAEVPEVSKVPVHPAAAPAPEPPRTADPVRQLMDTHWELCERAVHPLEIAAGLEAHGIDDRGAVARFRHRDVFSLAEELYVRVPRAEDAPPPPATAPSARNRGTRARTPLLLLPLLPGVLCALLFAALASLPADLPAAVPVAVGAAGTVAVLAAVRPALRLALRPAPQDTRPPGRTWGAALSCCCLLGYALYGDWLLAALLGGGPEPDAFAPVAARPAVPLTLAYAVAPAVWCARLFARRSRRRLAESRGLADFARRVRPLLGAVTALFAVALPLAHTAAALALEGRPPTAGALAGTAALGLLGFASLLLTAHGFAGAALVGTATAVAAEAAVLVCVPAARLPGLGALGRPVELVVSAWGTASVPVSAGALAALALLTYACRVLTGASAHHLRAEH